LRGRVLEAYAVAAAPEAAVPIGEQAQRVVPERVDLDGLAASRRHDPLADLRIHPRELEAWSASAVWYKPALSPSGNKFGSKPSRIALAKVLKIPFASAARPVSSVSPSRLIIVSRPQSVNQ